jgi:hypothetical protein
MMKTFTEWLRVREMAGGGPFIPGSVGVGKQKQQGFNVWGAQPDGTPYPQHMKKKCKKFMKP